MKKWNQISTMNYQVEAKANAKADIKECLENKTQGYWKQSIVCKLAAHAHMTMHYAWELFNELFLDIHDELFHVQPTQEEKDKAWKDFLKAPISPKKVESFLTAN